MTAKFNCTITTPKGIIFDQPIGRVTLKTEMGEITVLAHHETLMALVKKGPAVIEIDGTEQRFVFGDGVAEMRPGGNLLLLLNNAEKTS